MEVQPYEAEAIRNREIFFKMVFGQNEGIVCIAYASANKKEFREEFFTYPDQLDKMLETIHDKHKDHNMYFCPQLLGEKKRHKENVILAPNVWSDLDTCDPGNLLVEPTIIIESSPGRYQGYWVMEKPLKPEVAEDLSRRIAYKHAEDGADRSGWDLTQLLRIPVTYNYKYRQQDQRPIVRVISATRSLYRMADFKDYPESPSYLTTEFPMPDADDLPQDADELLQQRRLILNPMIWRLYDEEPDGDWSKALWNLQMLLFEANFTRDEVFVVARNSACNKYKRDKRPEALLWKEVCRAEAKANLNHQLLVPDPEKVAKLLSDEEQEIVEKAEPTFIDRYIKWASSLGDAAPQYHQAGAFICLSSLLCGSVRLPTSYGAIIPNIWFMILADTTLTRKSTSMDIATDLLEDVDPDLVMATDGSLEGLLTSLSNRPGKPSIFLRDEFSGLLEQMTKKDYMAGMPELLTKLYDGKMQKRILRKEVVEVRDPRLLMFAGGIKNKITSLLTFEHVSSGFMPRFVFITAESDIKRVKPLGPPTTKTTGGRDEILNELQDMYTHYNRMEEVHVEKLQTTLSRKMITEASLTPEAWFRYNQLESGLLELGLQSELPEIMTPVGDRLAKSILKAAVLIAASKARSRDVVVEIEDLLRAISYGQQWYMHSVEVMNNVGKNSSERALDKILEAVHRRGNIPRSKLMQSYHLTAQQTDMILNTLEQRGQITRQRRGRTEMIMSI